MYRSGNGFTGSRALLNTGPPRLPPVSQRKAVLRRRALAARRVQPGPEAASRAACARLIATAPYRRAGTILWYLDCGTELRTRRAVEKELAVGRRIAVPYVDGESLGLWRLETLGELSPGAFGILEPPARLRGEAGRVLDPGELDLVVLPGVAFDTDGNRLGYGKGYYDRLLARVRGDAARIGLCYECQLLPSIPREVHDRPADMVVTEETVHIHGR